MLHVVVFGVVVVLRRDSFVGRTFLLSMHHLSLSGEEAGRQLELHEMAKEKTTISVAAFRSWGWKSFAVLLTLLAHTPTGTALVAGWLVVDCEDQVSAG